MTELTDPLMYFKTRYPYNSDQIKRLAIGEKYVGIMLNNGQIGVCATLRHRIFPDISQSTDLDMENLQHRIIYNAWLNALLNYHGSYKSDQDIFEAINFSNEDQIVMVGYFGPLVKKFQKAKIKLDIFDFQTKNRFTESIQQLEDAVKHATTVILTSTSIFNGTFSGIIEKTQKDCRVFLLGPSSILDPYILSLKNISNIFGAIFNKFDSRILSIIENGYGTRKFLPLGKKVYI